MAGMFGILLFISGQEIIFVLLMVLLLFGSKEIPRLARTFGQGMREFRRATEDIKKEIESSTPDLMNDVNDIKRNLTREANEIKRNITRDTDVIKKNISRDAEQIKKNIKGDTAEITKNMTGEGGNAPGDSNTGGEGAVKASEAGESNTSVARDNNTSITGNNPEKISVSGKTARKPTSAKAGPDKGGDQTGTNSAGDPGSVAGDDNLKKESD
jgi:sec-independent protein translocase protein TatA